MRLLLVGNEGYLGSGLQAALGARHEVIGWGREADIARVDAATIRDRAIDAVVNCAVVIDRQTSALSIDSATYRVNVDGVRALVETLRGSTVRLIQLSTREVYGPVYGPNDVVERNDRFEPKFLVDEQRPFAPRSAYAKSKLIAEFIAEAHPYATTIRLSTCYTDHDHARGGWILNMAKTSLRGEAISIEGTGKQVRDPLHVEDLAALVELVATADPDRTRGLKLNAGGGPTNTLSVREIARLIDPSAEIRSVEGGDWGFALDNGRALELLGWRPTVRLVNRVEALRRHTRATQRGQQISRA